VYQLKAPYVTPSSGELRASFPVNGGQFAILRLSIPDVLAGDVLQIKAYCQASNNISGGPNVGVGSNIKGGTPGAETIALTRSNVRNVNGQRHHEPIVAHCTYVATQDWENFGVALFLYGLSDATSGTFTVDKNYGRLFVDHFATSEPVDPPPPPDPSVEGTVLDAVLDTTFGNATGKTVRGRVSASGLIVPPGDVTKIRLRLKAHVDEPIQLSHLYVGPGSGSAFAASSLVRLSVAGQQSFSIPAGTEAWTDWADFVWDEATPALLWSAYVSGGAAADKIAAAFPFAYASTAIKIGNEASAPNPSGLTAYADYLSLVSGIETDGFPVP
jgi:hypothetical protein